MPDANSLWLLVSLLGLIGLGAVVRFRFGSVMAPLKARLGDRWPLLVRTLQIATVAIWLTVWLAIDGQRRAELQQFFQDNAPWMRFGQQRQ